MDNTFPLMRFKIFHFALRENNSILIARQMQPKIFIDLRLIKYLLKKIKTNDEGFGSKEFTAGRTSLSEKGKHTDCAVL